MSAWHRVCLVTVGAAIVFVPMAAGDWPVGVPGTHKMHWPQEPDLSTEGIDVNATHFTLADDFECAEDGLVTRIHVWGSWYNDIDDPQVAFDLTLYADDPGGMPGPLLWTRTFLPGEYTARVFTNGIEAGWMDPPDVYFPPPADTVCWQYNFDIDPQEAFAQQAGTDYWLGVRATPFMGSLFGWKTARPDLQWGEAAQWWWSIPSMWIDLAYPPQHMLASQPLDLAFVIDGDRPPDPDTDFGDAPDPSYPTLLANNGASHSLDGRTFLGLEIDAEAEGLTDPAALGDDMDNLADEDGVVFLDPIVVGGVTHIEVIASTNGYLDAWLDFRAEGSWAEPEDGIFFSEPLAEGPNLLTFGVPYGSALGTSTYARFRFSTVGGLPHDGPAPDGEVEDYQVLIDPPLPQACCLSDGSCIDVDYMTCVQMGGDPQGPGTGCATAECGPMKWSQPPLYPSLDEGQVSEHPECFWGWDQPSVYNWGPEIVADDWVCTSSRPLADIHWWGGYAGWDLPNPPPDGPASFHLGIWTQAPPGPSFNHPDTLIWEVVVARDGLSERPVGCDSHPQAGGSDTCFRYDLDLPEAAWFHQPGDEATYWLTIAAVYPNDPPAMPWGWQTRPADSAGQPVVISDPLTPTLGSSYITGMPVQAGWDMAFVLTAAELFPPVADANGPYSGDEGSAILLDGSGSYDTDGTIVAYEWDLDENGVFGDATGVTALATWYDDGLFAPALRVTDNSGLADTATASVAVGNVDPVLVGTPVADDVLEGAYSTLTGSWYDPGTGDTFTVHVDWGDGNPIVHYPYAAGSTNFSEMHQYLDDNPSGTPQDSYTITVTLEDDDGGLDTNRPQVTVSNAPPILTGVAASPIPEGGISTLSGFIVDPGVLDSFVYHVDWGDGTASNSYTNVAGNVILSAAHLYLDDNPTGTTQDNYTITITLEDDDGGLDTNRPQVTVSNAPPILSGVSASPVPEGGVSTLIGSISDPGLLDTFTLRVDWGDGSPMTSSNYPTGASAFLVTHQYLDDDPTGTTQDNYTITITLEDDDGGIDTNRPMVTVSNAPPILSNVVASGSDEGGISTVGGTMVDPGTLDSFTLYVDWGDASPTNIYTYPAGVSVFSETHVYLDDEPTGTTQDNYTITIILEDDDGGLDTNRPMVTVSNAPPILSGVSATPTYEGEYCTLSGSMTDPGILDTFTVRVDWGDGNPIVHYPYGAGSSNFNETHQYLDDDPSGTTQDNYTITVTLEDDDGGLDTNRPMVTVSNAPPILTGVAASPIPEGGVSTLSGFIVDPGVLDSWTVRVDWGDGTTPTSNSYGAGITFFSIPHMYIDDDPSGTPEDDYTITVTLEDDDGGLDTNRPQVTVSNAPPIVSGPAITPTQEGGSSTLSGTFTDPGLLDTFALEVDWGDGTLHQTNYPAGSAAFLATHQYGASSNYVVSFNLEDDDLGASQGFLPVTVSNVPPVADADGPYWAEAGEEILLDGSGSYDPGNDIVFFEWDFDADGAHDDAAGTSVGFRTNTIGLLAVDLKVTDDDGATDTDSALVEVVPPAPCLKWLQPPDCASGLDVESWDTTPVSTGPARKVADDWLCDGRPLVGLAWWGSYIGWQDSLSDPGVPPPGGPDRPTGFRVSWFEDIPATSNTFSQPGRLLEERAYPLADFGPTGRVFGAVIETPVCAVTNEYGGPPTFEHEYLYTLEFLPGEEFNQKEGTVYWLSIEAMYQSVLPPPAVRWGWATTAPQHNWNDAAVVTTDPPTWQEMLWPPPGWEAIPDHPYAGQSVNMAYGLLTDVCPARCRKWIQPPDMAEGVNMLSSRQEGTPTGLRRADDFISDGRPITDIHWWGSYIDWRTNQPGFPPAIPWPPTGIERPIGFELTWLDNLPPCQPGAVLTNVFVAMDRCHESYYGTVTQSWNGIYEHEYQYYADLLDGQIAAAGAWPEMEGEPYWLSIQAVFDSNWVADVEHGGWGWKTTLDTNLCSALMSFDGAVWLTNTLPPGHPRGQVPYDLAFELTTTDIAPDARVTIASIAGHDAISLVSSGYCGCGILVLEHGTNLLSTAAWTAVATNAVPRPSNTWMIPHTSDTTRQFRVDSRQ